MTKKSIPTSVITRHRPNAKPDNSKELTSEKIAAHIEAFRARGGTVEKLGTTRVLGRVGEPVPAEQAKSGK